MADKIIVVKNREGCFLQTLNIGCAIVLAIVGLLVLGSCWMMHKASDYKPKPMTPQQKAEQIQAEKKIAVAIRLKDLEENNGGGRIRMDSDVENAARILYNVRNHARLPLLDKNPIERDAQEAASTPSAQKPTNDTPKPLAKPASAAQPPASIEPDEKPIREVRETETTCSSCSGLGTIPATVTCSKCAGAGRIYKAGKWQKCPKTMKRGTKPCPTCSGTGKIRTLE